MNKGLKTALKELKYEKMNVSHLLSILEEVQVITDDATVSLIVRNGLERHELDKMIHARLLFK